MNFSTISIGEVLADSQIAATPGGEVKTFSLKFAKDDGHVSTIGKASRNVKLGKATKGSHTNLRQQNLMLVYDHVGKSHKTITIALITHYNGVRVFH